MNSINRKADASKRFLETVLKKMQNIQFANSGGKDSLVIHTLLKEMGQQVNTFYANTTIDPPGTIKYIKEFMPETLICHPIESFYQIVKHKGLPTRLSRFCCERLKECHSRGKNNIEGVRAAESKGRRDRDFIQCDSRKAMKGAQHIYPIYEWADNDVWDFIKSRKLELAPHYEKGFYRLGCVGCPLVSSSKKRRTEFEAYPRYYEAIKKAITKGMIIHPHWKLSELTRFDGEKAMGWWLSGKTMNQYFDGQGKLF